MSAGIGYQFGRAWGKLPKVLKYAILITFAAALARCAMNTDEPASQKSANNVSAESSRASDAPATAPPAAKPTAPSANEIERLIAMVNDTKDTPQGRLAMLGLLAKASPAEAAKFSALQARLEAQVATIEGPASGKPITIPSDQKAQFTVLEMGSRGSARYIITKRVGSSGVTFSTREYDCSKGTVRYLGTGDTWQAMKRSKPDAAMSPIVTGSIAYYLGVEACK